MITLLWKNFIICRIFISEAAYEIRLLQVFFLVFYSDAFFIWVPVFVWRSAYVMVADVFVRAPDNWLVW